MMRVDWTLTWMMRAITVMRSRGFSNHAFASLRMPLFFSGGVILYRLINHASGVLPLTT